MGWRTCWFIVLGFGCAADAFYMHEWVNVGVDRGATKCVCYPSLWRSNLVKSVRDFKMLSYMTLLYSCGLYCTVSFSGVLYCGFVYCTHWITVDALFRRSESSHPFGYVTEYVRRDGQQPHSFAVLVSNSLSRTYRRHHLTQHDEVDTTIDEIRQETISLS